MDNKKQPYKTSVRKENETEFINYIKNNNIPCKINPDNDTFYILTLFATKKEIRKYRREFGNKYISA